jgi:pimeloyl-ACP methyl ester carboxylesterase
MAVPRFNPASSLLNAVGRFSPRVPLQTLIRSTRFRLLPPRPLPYEAGSRKAEHAVMAAGTGRADQRATILREYRRGGIPTIVLGGFVPDATEQVFLLRDRLLKSGSIYYVNYSPKGFSTDLLFAQLEDLIDDLASHGQRPVLFGVSFGVGLILEWMRRARETGRKIQIRGSIFISPVACIEDVLASGKTKQTLLGRAIKPIVEKEGHIDITAIQRARTIFVKMFEAGAQNKETMRTLMSGAELKKLRDAVIGMIQGIEEDGAGQRVHALTQMRPPSSYFSQKILPLSDAPTLIMYAEKESSVLTEQSPTRFALESAHRAYFPHSHFRVIANQDGNPVQHASLIFHCVNFTPPISAFYQHLKSGKIFKHA